MNTVRIAGAQGFYGDSPMAAIAIAQQQAADFLVHDALAELTLSILQKDRLADPNLGYARDIETLAKFLIPIAHKNNIRIITNSGGLNPQSAALKVAEILKQQGITNFKIATITGDDLLPQLPQLLQNGHQLRHLDTNQPFSQNQYPPTHANVYIGAKSIADALNQGANLILAGRVADPCLTLGILIHHFGWKLNGNLSQTDLNRLASGIAIGHLLECGGQASGGNSYAEWPMNYPLSNLGYPIAHVSQDGSATFTKLPTQGGKLTRNTLREQLVYEIHNPAQYITPDVTVNLTQIKLTQTQPNHVHLSGAIGSPAPEQLKLAIGLNEGYISEQLFFFSWPYAHQKCTLFIQAVKEIWSQLPIKIERQEFSIIGLNGIHGSAAPNMPPELLEQINELGVRIALKHTHPNAGKIAIQAVTCLGLNGPPGVVSMPAWGKINRVQLSLWPTLIPRSEVQENLNIIEI